MRTATAVSAATSPTTARRAASQATAARRAPPPTLSPRRALAASARADAEARAMRTPRAAPAQAGDITVYDLLRQAHQLQRQLCSRLVRLPASKPAERQAVFTALRLELAAHAAAEERALYVPMLMSDAGLDASRHALSEHHDIDELVEDLQGLALDGDAWQEKAKALSHKVRHHLQEEEKKFFQTSGKILTDAQKRSGARRYRRDHARLLKQLAAA